MTQSSCPEITSDVIIALRQEGLTPNDYQEIWYRLGRAPNRVELGMFGVMWCSYATPV